MIVGGVPLLLSSAPAGSVAEYSGLFVRSESDQFTASSFGTATNQDIGAISFFVKRNSISSLQIVASGVISSGSTEKYSAFMAGNTFRAFYNGATTQGFGSSETLTDTTEWHHILAHHNSSLATAADRVKVWLDGTELTNTLTPPALNENIYFGDVTAAIGDLASIAGAYELDAKISEFHFIDGSTPPVSDFAVDSGGGAYFPIEYTGSYGNNGFYLAFTNSGSLGEDTSGNTNNWTNSGVSQSTDIPE